MVVAIWRDFCTLLMVPGAITWGSAGTGIGSAAQWVTVILFIEVARRAHPLLGTLGNLRAVLHGRVDDGRSHDRRPALAAIFRSERRGGRQHLLTSCRVGGQRPGVGPIRKADFFHIDWLPAILMMIFRSPLSVS